MMYFYFSKLMGYILNPLAWIVIAMILAVFTRKPGKRKKFLIAAFLLLLIFTNPFIGDEAIRRWEKPLTKAPTETYTAGIILGGDIASYDKATDRVLFRSGADRLMQAIELFNTGVIKKIIISGGPGHILYRDRMEADYIRNYLVNIGINESDIIYESRSMNTIENATFTAQLMKENNITGTALLITSALHMRRAVTTFEKQGVSVEPYPTSKITGERLYNIDHLLIPSVVTLKNWNLLIHEWIGYFAYKFMGYN
jgi:uncharacterized SAM-binding protein YcdF (DUF218 family)